MSPIPPLSKFQKAAGRAVPLPRNEIINIAKQILAGAKYDEHGLIVGFSVAPIGIDITDVQGLPLHVAIVAQVDPLGLGGKRGTYIPLSRTVDIYYSDLRTLGRGLDPAVYRVLYHYVKDGVPTDVVIPSDKKIYNARLAELTSIMLHELTHARDIDVSATKPLPYYKYFGDFKSEDPEKVKRFDKAYYNSSAEVKAFIQQCVFEIRIAWQSTRKPLRELFAYSLTLHRMNELLERDIITKDVIRQLYVAAYTELTDHNVDPRTGIKKK